MHNRFRATLSCAAIALAALTTTPARAQVTRAFDGAATGTYPQGAGIDFFELGNFMQETFSGVGLASVNALNVDFRFQSNLTSSVAANRTMSFSVFLNGTAVGSLASTLFPIQPTAGNVLLSFVGFGNVNASGGNYTVRIVQSSTTLPGSTGSLSVLNSGPNPTTVTFNSTSSSTVPEPSTYVLCAAGLLAVGVASRRRKRLVVS